MIFPRLAALAEVDWSPKESRNWDDFSQRMKTQYTRYKQMGINFAPSAYQVSATPELNPEIRSLQVELSTEVSHPEIHYTLDGTEPLVSSPLYAGPIPVNKSSIIKAAVFDQGNPLTTPLNREFFLHKAIACPVSLKYPNNPRYKAGGKYTLVDGVKGTSNYADGNWLAFYKDDMVATVDLVNQVNIKSIEADGIQDAGSWIFMPREVIFEVSSDGINYKTLGKVGHKISVDNPEIITHDFMLKKKAGKVRFVRVTAKNIGVCPKGHAGEGQPAWLFSSEIIVK
jgi:hexosaminidase